MVYERASKQVVPIANLPAIWFSSILPANDASGDLILNSSIRYYPKTGQWESWSPAADCQDLRYRVFDGMHLLTAFAAATAYTNNDGIVQALPTGSYIWADRSVPIPPCFGQTIARWIPFTCGGLILQSKTRECLNFHPSTVMLYSTPNFLPMGRSCSRTPVQGL